MGVETGIQWTHHSWSPWRGCAKVSTGCKFCYAEKWGRRNRAVFGEWGPDGKRVVNADWDGPRRWDRAAARAGERRRIFPSFCDWLEDRDDLAGPRARFLDLIEATPNLDWVLLTKRPGNFDRLVVDAAEADAGGRSLAGRWADGHPPPNVWHGVSVEDQATADARLPVLMATPAALHWVSYEPAIGPVDFGRRLNLLDWIVVGGESGALEKVRPFDVQWARSTVADCKAAGVAVFVKQLGTRPYDSARRISITGPGSHAIEIDLAHPKGGDPDEWPEDLRVREYPAAVAAGAS